jgi:hypothetical protein
MTSRESTSNFIGGASEPLDIVQELDSLPTAQAILDARWRGVSVRIVLEQDCLQDERSPTRRRIRARQQSRHGAGRSGADDPPMDLDMNRWI